MRCFCVHVSFDFRHEIVTVINVAHRSAAPYAGSYMKTVSNNQQPSRGGARPNARLLVTRSYVVGAEHVLLLAGLSAERGISQSLILREQLDRLAEEVADAGSSGG